MKKTVKPDWKPHLSLGGLLIAVGTELSKQGKRELSEMSLGHLSYGRIGVLACLTDGPQTQAELSRRLGQKPPSVMEMLARLRKEGLIEATPSPTHAKSMLWALTPHGKASAVSAKNALRKMGRRLDAHLEKEKIDEKELARFKEILLGLLKNYFKRTY